MANLSLPTTFYPPLDNNTQQIRLLSFKDDGNFALEVFDLADRPDYIALSYVWGSPDEVDEIIVNGRSFSIHQNLFLALRAIGWHLRNFAEGQGKNEKSKLRVSGRGMEVETEIPEVQNAQSAKDEDVALSPGRWKYFWIDAICINQDDIPERNSQVQRMGDLYTNASFVMVWLGPDVDESLAHISKFENGTLELYSTASDVEIAEDVTVKNFFGAAYWRRLWIIQEFVLARTLLFVSDTRTIPLDVLMSKLWFNRDASVRRYPFVHTALSLRTSTRNVWLTLSSLLVSLGSHECLDKRDRVYGLLALVDWTGFRQPPIKADYSLSAKQLYGLICTIYSSGVDAYYFTFVAKELGVEPNIAPDV